jgi:hypothetical protein
MGRLQGIDLYELFMCSKATFYASYNANKYVSKVITAAARGEDLQKISFFGIRTEYLRSALHIY